MYPVRTTKTVAKRWKSHYKDSYGWKDCGGVKGSEEIYHELVGLGKEPDPDKVDKVIGNNAWTRNCREEI